MISTFVALLEVYEVAGANISKEEALSRLDRYQFIININRLALLASVALFFIWIFCVIKKSNAANKPK